MSASETESASEDEIPEPILPSSKAPYEKISCLGEGAFGAVWLARCKSSGTYMALKEVSRHVADPVLLQPERDILRQIQEARQRGDFVSPALTSLLGTFVTPFAVVLAMDLVEGTHLLDHLRAEGRLEESRVQWYTAEISMALDWLHKAGWLYRDLKLTNVMLSLSQNSYGRVKLIDFGFAQYGLWSDKALGTLQTMAPEVISCVNPQWAKELKIESPQVGYGPKADWWSLGVIFLELLTGEPPFGHHDDLLLEGFQVLRRQVLEGVQARNLSDAAKEAARSLCQVDLSKRPGNVESLKSLAFFGGAPWSVLASEAPGPSFKALGFTIASASEDHICRPRRGAALPPTLEGPDPFQDF